MNVKEAIRNYLRRRGDFDIYYGFVNTNYGVSFYVSINSLELKPEDTVYTEKCKVSAMAFNPLLAISAMNVLFGKKDWIIDGDEEESKPVYEVKEEECELTEDLILKMNSIKNEVIELSVKHILDNKEEFDEFDRFSLLSTLLSDATNFETVDHIRLLKEGKVDKRD